MAFKVPLKAKKNASAPDFYAMEVFLFKTFGIWRSSDPKSFYNTWRFRAFSALVVSLLLFFQAFGVSFIVINRKTINIPDLANAVFIYGLAAIYDLMKLTIIVKIKLIEDLLERTHSKLFIPRNEKEMEIMELSLKTAFRYRLIFHGGLTFSLLFTSILNLIISEEQTPIFVAYIPPWIGFYTFITIQISASLLRSLLISTLITFTANTNIFLTAQLEILKVRLEYITGRKEVAICTQHYLEIRRFAELFMGYYGVPGLISFMAHVIILCTTSVVLSEADRFGKVFFAVFLVSVLSGISVQAWHGNEVSTKSNELTVAIYNSNWIGANESHKKLILLIAMTTARPIVMDFAGRFASMSLASLVWVLQTAYKCYTLMQQFK